MKPLLLFVSGFICCLLFLLEHCLVFSFNSPSSMDYYSDTVLLEVVNSELTVEKNEIEQFAKEIEIESKRPVVNINYVLNFINTLPTEDCEKRGKILIGEKEGVPTTFLNGRVVLRGRPGLDDFNERKKYIKNYIKEYVLKIIHKEYFTLLNFTVTKTDSYSYKLNVVIRAEDNVENKLLSGTKVLLFLVADKVKSEVSQSLVHKNVAYRFIPVKGFENEEFDGTGNSLHRIINKDAICEGDEIEIESVKFDIDKNITAEWSCVIIIENDKRREVLFVRKFRFNGN